MKEKVKMIKEFVFWVAVLLTSGGIYAIGQILLLEAKAIKCKNGK